MLRLLEYLVARSFLAMLQSLPYDASLRLARSLARLLFRFKSTPQRRTVEHLRFAYGDTLSLAQVDTIACGVFESMLCHAAEAAHIFRRDFERLRVENAEILKAAYARGRGVVVVSAHMGYFVRMAVIPRMLDVSAAIIMKNQRNDRLLRWGIRELKRRYDLDVILKKQARDSRRAASWASSPTSIPGAAASPRASSAATSWRPPARRSTPNASTARSSSSPPPGRRTGRTFSASTVPSQPKAQTRR